jgi:hypothetical protein
VCEDWHTRIRVLQLRVAAAAGHHHAVLFHASALLPNLRSAFAQLQAKAQPPAVLPQDVPSAADLPSVTQGPTAALATLDPIAFPPLPSGGQYPTQPGALTGAGPKQAMESRMTGSNSGVLGSKLGQPKDAGKKVVTVVLKPGQAKKGGGTRNEGGATGSNPAPAAPTIVLMRKDRPQSTAGSESTGSLKSNLGDLGVPLSGF